MQLEDYLEFSEPSGIRIRGTRIGIETIVTDYQRGKFPEQIAASYYPSLTLERVYAALTYYLHNEQSMEEYLKQLDEQFERAYETQEREKPPAVVQRLRELKAQRQRAEP
jgi:uncharacterized protein (DUF433 family)